MAGHGVEDDPNLKGLSRYFNSQTNRGRANVSFLLFSSELRVRNSLSTNLN